MALTEKDLTWTQGTSLFPSLSAWLHIADFVTVDGDHQPSALPVHDKDHKITVYWKMFFNFEQQEDRAANISWSSDTGLTVVAHNAWTL